MNNTEPQTPSPGSVADLLDLADWVLDERPLSDVQRTQLNSLLLGSEQLRKVWCSYTDISASLHLRVAEGKLPASSSSQSEPVLLGAPTSSQLLSPASKTPDFLSPTPTAEIDSPAPVVYDLGSAIPPQRRRRFIPLALAAMAVAGVGIALFQGFLGDVSQAASTARLVHRDGARWELANGSQAFFQDGMILPGGPLRLVEGVAEVHFDNGTIFKAKAPSLFQIKSNMSVELLDGLASAEVGPRGKGFTIEIPEVDVVDLGTAFGVLVDGSDSEVHVFDGLVDVDPPVGDSVSLEVGEALRIPQLDGQSLADVAVRMAANPDKFRMDGGGAPKGLPLPFFDDFSSDERFRNIQTRVYRAGNKTFVNQVNGSLVLGLDSEAEVAPAYLVASSNLPFYGLSSKTYQVTTTFSAPKSNGSWFGVTWESDSESSFLGHPNTVAGFKVTAGEDGGVPTSLLAVYQSSDLVAEFPLSISPDEPLRVTLVFHGPTSPEGTPQFLALVEDAVVCPPTDIEFSGDERWFHLLSSSNGEQFEVQEMEIEQVPDEEWVALTNRFVE